METGKGDEGFQVTFTHTFTYGADETCYFAFSYPFSLEEVIKQGQRFYKKYYDSDTIYFHKEVLALSLEKRPMELWTLTGKDDKIQYGHYESLIGGLFPTHNDDVTMRPFLVKKPTVFLTARVHPGETPASFVLNGILNFLTNEKSE